MSTDIANKLIMANEATARYPPNLNDQSTTFVLDSSCRFSRLFNVENRMDSKTYVSKRKSRHVSLSNHLNKTKVTEPNIYSGY